MAQREQVLATEFLGEEYPTNFEFYQWVIDLVSEGGVELIDGEIIGEVNTLFPDQYLYYEQGAVVGRAKPGQQILGDWNF